jgi:ribonuclease P protein component
LQQKFRLTRSEDINHVRQQGRSYAHRKIVLGVIPNQTSANRIAVIAGRTVGGAVQRNLAKRRIRSAYQNLESNLHQGFDLVIIARKLILEEDYHSLVGALRMLFEQAGLMKE